MPSVKLRGPSGTEKDLCFFGRKTNLGLRAARNDKYVQMMLPRVGRFFTGREKKEKQKEKKFTAWKILDWRKTYIGLQPAPNDKKIMINDTRLIIHDKQFITNN